MCDIQGCQRAAEINLTKGLAGYRVCWEHAHGNWRYVLKPDGTLLAEENV